MQYPTHYDVIVVGGGHAGTEAAMAAARMGQKTLLLTHSIDTLGQMSCNPAIGGIGKGHLVKEIDALGGLMAQATDKAGIQFRILNASKGPAVRATRAQADRVLYRAAVREALESQPNLDLFQQAVDDLILDGDKVTGVVTQMGLQFMAHTVVLTVGTFLKGLIHIGMNNYEGGRAGCPPSNRLAMRLRELPFNVGRLKTGTPPRIDGRTIDYSQLQVQPGDTPTPVFSYMGSVLDHPRQIPCYITHTNESTHDIIREGLSRSPLYQGEIEGVGPRYCPSIEDKIHRFSEKNSHQIFVEPEGLTTPEIYPNGISTSLPFDIQLRFVRTMKGFENAYLTRPGYAIEYDFFCPKGLKPSLETKFIKNLFFAGQINGTTGYEEAAAQGLIAGLNAALLAQGKESWTPRRDEAYIGVLIDDLITHGTIEPYRMFTSRAEYRLMLREDNADLRLTPIGRELGLVDDKRWKHFEQKQAGIQDLISGLKQAWFQPQTSEGEILDTLLEKPMAREVNGLALVARPELSIDKLQILPKISSVLDSLGHMSDTELAQVKEQVEIQAKYAGYIERQEREVQRQKQQEDTKIPEGFNYVDIPGLSKELQEKLSKTRPTSVGMASRIPGMTPSAISILLVYLKARRVA